MSSPIALATALAAVFVLAGCGGGTAESSGGRALCRDATLARDLPSLFAATVSGSGKIGLLNDHGGCPSASKDCQSQVSVTGGQTVLVGSGAADYACVYTPNRATGWMPLSDLTALPRDETLRWSGVWIKGFVEIDTGMTDGRVSVRASNGGAGRSSGGFTGVVDSSGDTVAIKQGACDVSLRLVGDQLAVTDNHQCTQTTGSFTGVYQRSVH